MLQQLILFMHLLFAFTLIGLVLLQHGRGADAGAAFGSGASGTVFGSAGSATFLTKITTLIAALLAVTSISLTLVANRSAPQTLTERLLEQEQKPGLQPPPPAVEAPAEVPGQPTK